MVLHTTAKEHFAKLENVYSRLQSEVHKDDLDDFLQTANRIPEIVDKDLTSSRQQRQLARVVRSDEQWRILP